MGGFSATTALNKFSEAVRLLVTKYARASSNRILDLNVESVEVAVTLSNAYTASLALPDSSAASPYRKSNSGSPSHSYRFTNPIS